MIKYQHHSKTQKQQKSSTDMKAAVDTVIVEKKCYPGATRVNYTSLILICM